MSADFTVPLNGVEVGFRAFTSGQLIMMSKALRKARKEASEVGEDQAMVNMVVKMLDMIEGSIVDEDHIDHLESSMLQGKLNFPEIMLIMRQGRDVEPEPQDDADPVDKPRANKTRTKKD